MKKLWLFVLALALPVAMVAQSPTVNQGTILTPKQITSALRAVKNAKVQAPAAGQLVARNSPAGLAAPSSSLPVIAPGLFTVGTALADITESQPTPCFSCLITTDSPNTFGLALPGNVFPSGDAT